MKNLWTCSLRSPEERVGLTSTPKYAYAILIYDPKSLPRGCGSVSAIPTFNLVPTVATRPVGVLARWFGQKRFFGLIEVRQSSMKVCVGGGF